MLAMISGGRLKDFKSLPVPAPFSPLERDNRVDTGQPSHRWATKAECPRFPCIYARTPSPQGTPWHWRGRSLGNLIIEDAYLYPVPAPAA
jgi:hypothetical protein